MVKGAYIISNHWKFTRKFVTRVKWKLGKESSTTRLPAIPVAISTMARSSHGPAKGGGERTDQESTRGSTLQHIFEINDVFTCGIAATGEKALFHFQGHFSPWLQNRMLGIPDHWKIHRRTKLLELSSNYELINDWGQFLERYQDFPPIISEVEFSN